MRPAQQRLKQDLDAANFKDLSVPLVNKGGPGDPQRCRCARRALSTGAQSGALTASIRRLARSWATRFIETGPGGVLTGLCRQIEPTLEGVKFGEPADLEKVKDAQS